MSIGDGENSKSNYFNNNNVLGNLYTTINNETIGLIGGRIELQVDYKPYEKATWNIPNYVEIFLKDVLQKAKSGISFIQKDNKCICNQPSIQMNDDLLSREHLANFFRCAPFDLTYATQVLAALSNRTEGPIVIKEFQKWCTSTSDKKKQNDKNDKNDKKKKKHLIEPKKESKKEPKKETKKGVFGDLQYYKKLAQRNQLIAIVVLGIAICYYIAVNWNEYQL